MSANVGYHFTVDLLSRLSVHAATRLRAFIDVLLVVIMGV